MESPDEWKINVVKKTIAPPEATAASEAKTPLEEEIIWPDNWSFATIIMLYFLAVVDNVYIKIVVTSVVLAVGSIVAHRKRQIRCALMSVIVTSSVFAALVLYGLSKKYMTAH